MDRTELILAIFEKRAKTKEAKLQVELAQLEYQLPRLAHQWTHLSRIVGIGAGHGMGTTRGPGETQLQLDRKLIRSRISALKNQLDEVKQHRQIQRKNREELLSVAIVGYTNAGKSTLLNALTGENARVEDKLFATLDPMTRLVFLPDERKVLITDTVGFIRKLPYHLVASFRATLEEVVESDILLHVVDASHPEVYKQIEAVNRVLDEIGLAERPVLMVLNKVDKLENYNDLFMLQRDYPEAIPISAISGEGLDQLKSRLSSILIASRSETTICLKLSAADGKLISDIHEYGKVSECRYENDSVFITATMPKKYADKYRKQETENREQKEEFRIQKPEFRR
jgi:GTP-binding protein HflX